MIVTCYRMMALCTNLFQHHKLNKFMVFLPLDFTRNICLKKKTFTDSNRAVLFIHSRQLCFMGWQRLSLSDPPILIRYNNNNKLTHALSLACKRLKKELLCDYVCVCECFFVYVFVLCWLHDIYHICRDT